MMIVHAYRLYKLILFGRCSLDSGAMVFCSFKLAHKPSKPCKDASVCSNQRHSLVLKMRNFPRYNGNVAPVRVSWETSLLLILHLLIELTASGCEIKFIIVFCFLSN